MNSKATRATILASLLSAPMFSVAETYITYPDGSMYTVPEEERVYVTAKRVFSFTKGETLYRFDELLANAVRDGDDYPVVDAPPVDEPPVDEPPLVDPVDPPVVLGSHEWCKSHVLWANGFSFDDQTFVRACDTNNDYKYGCGDERFDASDDGEVCPS
jgi:hypothetical protein